MIYDSDVQNRIEGEWPPFCCTVKDCLTVIVSVSDAARMLNFDPDLEPLRSLFQRAP